MGEARTMTTIVLPPDLEDAITKEATRRGVAPETVAVDGLRRLFPRSEEHSEQPGPASLFDSLAGHIGTIQGVSDAVSEGCGDRFADAMVESMSEGACDAHRHRTSGCPD